VTERESQGICGLLQEASPAISFLRRSCSLSVRGTCPRPAIDALASGATYHNTIQQTRTIFRKYSADTANEVGYNNLLTVFGLN
jgi:hypothetical protein